MEKVCPFVREMCETNCVNNINGFYRPSKNPLQDWECECTCMCDDEQEQFCADDI